MIGRRIYLCGSRSWAILALSLLGILAKGPSPSDFLYLLYFLYYVFEFEMFAITSVAPSGSSGTARRQGEDGPPLAVAPFEP